jgi:hypothetical protein
MRPEFVEHALRALTDAKPFRSFVIELTNGSRITIASPQELSAVNTGLSGLYQVRQGDGQQFFDASSVCQVYDRPDADLEIDEIPF